MHLLTAHGELNRYPITWKSGFEFTTCCNSKLYPFSIFYVPAAFSRYDEQPFPAEQLLQTEMIAFIGRYDVDEELQEVQKRVQRCESALVAPFQFPGTNCILLFQRKHGRGANREVSFFPVDCANANALFTNKNSKAKLKPRLGRKPKIPKDPY